MYPYDFNSVQQVCPFFGFLRFLHASPDAPKVDVYVDLRLLAKNVSFSEITRYIRLLPGEYNIRVFEAGKTERPVIQRRITIELAKYYTVAAINRVANINLFTINDEKPRMGADRGSLRVVHLSPNAPSVDITQANGNVLFADVSYREVTPYKASRPRTAVLIVKPVRTNREVLRFNVVIQAGINKTAYILGLVGERPQLSAKVVVDNGTVV